MLETLERHLFNNEVWPDFTRLSLGRRCRPWNCAPCRGRGVEIAGLTVRAGHDQPPGLYRRLLPAAAPGRVSLFGGYHHHRGPLAAGGRLPAAQAAFIETSFPNRLAELARISGHLTPAMLGEELAKLDRPRVPVGIFHMKPQFLEELRRNWRP